MQPYWTKVYKYDNEEHTVELFRYSKNSICVISTHFFLNGFRNNFESAKGTYNQEFKNLKRAGFLFHIDDQDDLVELLQNIFTKKVVMTDNTEIINSVVELTTKLNKLILDNKNMVYTTSQEGIITKLSFKNDSDNKDNLVVSFESSKGVVNLFQVQS